MRAFLLAPVLAFAASSPTADYASPLLDYFLQVPASWEVSEAAAEVEFTAPDHARSRFGLSVRTSPSPYGAATFEAWKARRKEKASDFRMTGEAELRIGGARVRRIAFVSPGPFGEMRHLFAFIESRRGTFELDCRFLSTRVRELSPRCDTILASFRADPSRRDLPMREFPSADGGFRLAAGPGWRDVTEETRGRVPDAVLALSRPAGNVSLRAIEAAPETLPSVVEAGLKALAAQSGAKPGELETMRAGGAAVHYAVASLPDLEILTGAFSTAGRAYAVEAVSRSRGTTRPLVRSVIEGVRPGAPAPAPKIEGGGGRGYLLAFIFGGVGIALVYGLAMLYLSLPYLERRASEANLLMPGEFIREAKRPTAVWAPPMRAIVSWWPVPAWASGAPPEVRKVGVVGAGTMGAGIAQLLAEKGFDVALYDADPAALRAGLDRIEKRFRKAKRPERLARIEPVGELEPLGACDLVIEAVREDLEVKRKLFERLSALLAAPKVLATNTSSLPIRGIAGAAASPERVVGMHFFNPAPVMALVEIIPHAGTSASVRRTAAAFAEKLGKTPVLSADSPGFIANRLVRPFYLKPMAMLAGGEAGIEPLDKAMRLSGFKMGAFELIDLIGLDVNLVITKVLHKAFGERFRPPKVQEDLVERGQLGRKTGAGFYRYVDGRARGPNLELVKLVPEPEGCPDPDVLFRKVLDEVEAEARRMLDEGVASAEDIDRAMRLGFRWPQGPLKWQKEISSRKESSRASS